MICVSIAGVSASEAAELIRSNELSEVRLDSMDFTLQDIKKLFSSGKQTIATLRPCEKFTDTQREEILRAAIDAGATMVDMEVENSDEFKDTILSAAKTKGCSVIISYHDYNKTPVLRELEQIVDWCFSSGADIAKVACRADSFQDCARLLSLYNTDRQIISIGMGEEGRITRIAAPLLGAPFTYGSLDEERKTAPGQIESEKLRTIIDLIRS